MTTSFTLTALQQEVLDHKADIAETEGWTRTWYVDDAGLHIVEHAGFDDCAGELENAIELCVDNAYNDGAAYPVGYVRSITALVDKLRAAAEAARFRVSTVDVDSGYEDSGLLWLMADGSLTLDADVAAVFTSTDAANAAAAVAKQASPAHTFEVASW